MYPIVFFDALRVNRPVTAEMRLPAYATLLSRTPSEKGLSMATSWNSRARRSLRVAPLLLAAALTSGCSDDEEEGVLQFIDTVISWTCDGGESCQDVFDAGAEVTIDVHNVSAGSVAQIALYGPGVALGGTNLLTGTTNELRCDTTDDCNAHTAGVSYTMTVPTSGTYRLAVTRDWGNSCGGSGSYDLEVTADEELEVGGQTADDVTSAAPGFECAVSP